MENSFKRTKHLLALFLMLAIATVVSLGVIDTDNRFSVIAANPTFFFSEDRCSSGADSSITMPEGNNKLYLCVDGSDEELRGAEVHIPYIGAVSGVNVFCNIFDTCINLSETGVVKLLAASGPLSDGGNPVTDVRLFATISMTLTGGSATFTTSKADIINENDEVKSRNQPVITINTGPSLCGNGSIDGDEECDGLNLNGATCVSRGYDGGTLSCSVGCRFNESGCTIEEEGEEETEPIIYEGCGNGLVYGDEQCDPAASSSSWLYSSCVNAGFTGGDLTCDSTTCILNYSGCEGSPPYVSCGNRVIEPGEECDDGNTADGDGCSSVCEREEAGEEVPEEPAEEGEKILSGVTLSVTPATLYVHNADGTFESWETSNANAFARYSDGSSKNVTSPSDNPNTYYSVTGAVAMTCNICSKVYGKYVGPGTVTVTYSEGGKMVTSPTVNLSVSEYTEEEPPAEEEVEEPVEEEWVEEPTEEEVIEPVGEGAEEPSEEEVHPAAMSAEEKMISDATTVIEKERPLEEVGLEVTTEPDDDNCVQGYSNEVDSDGDGLTDRTECYIGTDPNNFDTDGDSCWDGAEINQFYTNPLISDCQIEVKVQQSVVITDPQPGWVIRKLEVSGITPTTSTSVSAVVFNAEYKELSATVKALKDLTGNPDEETENKIIYLQEKISNLGSFIAGYPDYDYEDLAEVLETLKEQIVDLMVSETDEGISAAYDELSASLEMLKAMQEEPVNLGSTSDLGDMDVGGQLAKGFHLSPDVSLTDGKLYDVVAVATLPGDVTVTSAPVRFSIDSTLDVNKPIPRSIGGKSIPAGAIALGNIFIGDVKAENGVEIEITEEKPTVAGSSEYGAQVFAVWESVVLASSIISDSDQGAFAIQAPRNLETDTSHKVTLYALKTDEEGQKMRSENVDVYFLIKPALFAWGPVSWTILILLALAIFIYILSKGLRKKEEAEGKEEIAKEISKAEEVYKESIPQVTTTPTPAPTPAPAPPAPKVDEQSAVPPAEQIAQNEDSPWGREAKSMEEEVKQEPATEPQAKPEESVSEEHKVKEEELAEAFKG
jgi:cysteine-rich repeat protein